MSYKTIFSGIIVLIILGLTGGYFLFTKPKNAEIGNKVNDVYNVSTVRLLGEDLMRYFTEKKVYPKTLTGFFNDDSYRSRTFMLDKNKINEFSKKYGYKISEKQDHFVVSTELLLTKSELEKVDGKPVDVIKEPYLGVNCANSHTYCVTDLR